MSATFLLLATSMTIAAVALLSTPWLRSRSKAEQAWARAHRALQSLDDSQAEGRIDPAQYAAQRAALGESLLTAVGDEPRRSTPVLYTALVVAVLVPLLAAGIYRWSSQPQPMHGSNEIPGSAAAPVVDHGGDMQAAIAKLADKLRQHPDDAQGWALLARTYKATQHYPEARDAFQHALEAAPGDAGLKREYAEAETPDRSPDPMDAQEEAAEQGAGVAQGTAPNQRSSVADGAAGSLPAPSIVGRTSSPHIRVKVALDPKFKSQVQDSDTLFIFAKAVQGPPMPLAIARLTASRLPASVTLTDAMSMMPNITLSQFSQIVVGARISKSGNAIAQSGDLQALSGSIANTRLAAVTLVIDHKVE